MGASLASANALKRAKGQFASKISMLTNVISANSKRAQRDLQRVTGVVHNIAKAAANVFKIVNGKRQKIADNYLSLKAYAVASADLVIDYRKKGKNGRNLSSVGDLLQTVSALGAVKPPKAEGLGMGGDKVPY